MSGVKKASKTVRKSKTTRMELKNTINMENVKSITYSVSEKSVAAVTKNGVINREESGSCHSQGKSYIKERENKDRQNESKSEIKHTNSSR